MTKVNKILAINFLVMGFFIVLTLHTALLINKSVSLPGKVFLLVKGAAFNKGDFVGIRDHQTLYTGTNKHFTKRIVGVPGDLITVVSNRVYINKTFIGLTKPKTKDHLPLTPVAEQIIPSNKFFVVTEHKDSFDSRYQEFGLVGRQHIEGKVYHIL